MKKTFLQFQEDKVKLMREDEELQKQQEKVGLDLQGLRESRSNYESLDSNLNHKLEEMMKEFEKLKQIKDSILKKDSDLERKSKNLKVNIRL